MRLPELIEGADGKLDEQSALSILGVLTFLALESYSVVVMHQIFNAESFGFGFGAVMGATLAGLGYRASKGQKNAGIPDQPGS
jgi:hypothetical protein